MKRKCNNRKQICTLALVCMKMHCKLSPCPVSLRSNFSTWEGKAQLLGQPSKGMDSECLKVGPMGDIFLPCPLLLLFTMFNSYYGFRSFLSWASHTRLPGADPHRSGCCSSFCRDRNSYGLSCLKSLARGGHQLPCSCERQTT